MKLLRAIIFAHRWLGIAVCLLFVPWFVSGIVMMYGGGFPEITAAERLRRLAPLDISQVKLTPAEVWKHPGAPDEVRLAMQDGRPLYHFRAGREVRAVYADDGTAPGPESFAREASRWAELPAGAAATEVLNEPDQWTVQSLYRPLRPLTRFRWPTGEEVYVSHPTGEVVQATTTGKRTAAYFGAVIHWIYFLPLRRDSRLWNDVVVWTSGVGTVASVFGMVVGLWLYSPKRKKYRYEGKPSSVGFTGQKRWHTIFGLIFGLSTCGWVFSGMLSMDPFPADGPTGGATRTRLATALRDKPDLSRISLGFSIPPGAKEVEFATFAGAPGLIALPAGKDALTPEQIVTLATAAVAPAKIEEVRNVTAYENYYGDRHGKHPLPVVLVRIADPRHSSFYIDPKTARIAQSYDTRARWNRWLYEGLHLMDLPALYRNRPLWDIVMLFFLVGGTAVSVTSVVLAVQVLQKKLGAR